MKNCHFISQRKMGRQRTERKRPVLVGKFLCQASLQLHDTTEGARAVGRAPQKPPASPANTCQAVEGKHPPRCPHPGSEWKLEAVPWCQEGTRSGLNSGTISGAAGGRIQRPYLPHQPHPLTTRCCASSPKKVGSASPSTLAALPAWWLRSTQSSQGHVAAVSDKMLCSSHWARSCPSSSFHRPCCDYISFLQ